MTINNVQGNGGAHWVAIYFANGDSTYRNVTVRSVDGYVRVRIQFSPTNYLLLVVFGIARYSTA